MCNGKNLRLALDKKRKWHNIIFFNHHHNTPQENVHWGGFNVLKFLKLSFNKLLWRFLKSDHLSSIQLADHLSSIHPHQSLMIIHFFWNNTVFQNFEKCRILYSLYCMKDLSIKVWKGNRRILRKNKTLQSKISELNDLEWKTWA